VPQVLTKAAIFTDKGKGSMLFLVKNIESEASVWLKYCLGRKFSNDYSLVKAWLLGLECISS
jgi:hypothetical protein